jgi:poly(3-hydroxybutyrate) depolymerase
MAESRENVKSALMALGWEVKTEDERPDAVMAGHGKYHLMVSFEATEPTSVIVSYVGRGGAILSMKWSGVERLPTPRSVVRVLSKDA